MKTVAGQKYNILYGRLSQEDERQGESNSIHNQQLFLQRYAEENGFENTLFLADDGYSGTNFERPSWKKIVEMIERSEVETLIVKDLSRLGREYLQVGQYTEIYFPEKGVRFIAVNHSVDSLVESSNDFNPIRNWANELHAKDTSKKVRAIKKMQAERGERLGGRPPYGYRKKDGIPRISFQMRKPLLWCDESLNCVLRVKARTRLPESSQRNRC
jgi:DNA invertase Pin-like site-specific DNA recombinase